MPGIEELHRLADKEREELAAKKAADESLILTDQNVGKTDNRVRALLVIAKLDNALRIVKEVYDTEERFKNRICPAKESLETVIGELQSLYSLGSFIVCDDDTKAALKKILNV